MRRHGEEASMRTASSTYTSPACTSPASISEQLQSARALLGQGRAGEAERVIQAVLEHRAGFPPEDLACSCGLLGRLLARRGERIKAALMAELAVQVASAGPGRADAYLDQADTWRLLGDRDEALACLRRARELGPADLPAAI
jgi:tetratricopeptide (TPR) repeat protein